MFEAFAIGIRLRLLDSVSSGLLGMAGKFAAFNQHVAGSQANLKALEDRLQRIKMMGAVGGAMMGIGLGGLALFKAPLEEAAKFDQQVAKFRLFGLGDQVNSEAVKFAKGMNIIGTSSTEAMRHMVEAQGVFRESGLSGSAALAGAKLAAPTLAKIDFATEALDDESKARMRASSLAMLRFVEIRGGLQSPQAFNAIADAGWKAIQTSGGNINWEALRQFMARGGVAAQGLSNTALFGELEPIIGEMKGSTAGNSLMTAYNRLVGGVRVPNQIAHLLADNGIWDKSKIVWNDQGGIKRFNGNPLRDFTTFASDPMAFYQHDILPMYAKMHLDTAADRARENTMIFGRTGGAMFSLIDRQQTVAANSVAAQAKALGLDGSVGVAGATAQGQAIDLHAKFNTLMAELGTTILPIAIRGLEGLTAILKGAISFAQTFPTLTKGLMISFGILSGLVAAGGALTLATAGFKALGLAMEVRTGASVGGMLLEAAAGFAGPLGLIAGIVGLGVAVAGSAWALNRLLPKKNDGQAHPNDHWVAGEGRSGAGGSWEGNTRWVGEARKRHQEYWNADAGGWSLTPGGSPYVGAGTQPKMNITVQNKLTKTGLQTMVFDGFGKLMNSPSTGVSGFDGSLSLAPAGGVGGGK